MSGNKENAKAVAGCILLIAEALICTGIGGFYGWAVGTTIFGIALLAHTVRGISRIKRMP